ncbi:MAG: response regulator [Thermoanaerobaculia bacterium]
MIRVCLVEDQTIVREGLRALLELLDDIEIVAEAADGEEALTVIAATDPDVVLLDLHLPKRDGLAVLRALADPAPPPATLILTTFDEDALVLEALKAGARGYLRKDVSLDELAGAIRRIAAGGTAVQPAVTARIVEGLSRLGSSIPGLELPDPLTEREQEILRLVANGFSNREIAEALHLAEGTVKNHVSSILSKLGVRDRTRAVLKAVELGYLA